jgi:hypothetical protein
MKKMKFTTRPFAILLMLYSITWINSPAIASLPTGNNPDPKGGIIQGKILDSSTNKPMEYVNIALFNATDSSLVTGTITSDQGLFKLEKLPLGSYFLRISFLGFDKKQTGKIDITSDNLTSDIGLILLKATSSNLGEVSIEAEKSKVEYQIDKRIINVDQAVVAKGGSAVNVL